jgi:hypothetical protein
LDEASVAGGEVERGVEKSISTEEQPVPAQNKVIRKG